MTLLEPIRPVRAELVVRRSRFVGYGEPAATVAEAEAVLARIRAEHADASHVVHASLVGAPEREIGSLTDAGEPKGTAGRPVMEILRGSGVRNVVIAVVRYFGGVKLGTGGLVRAYGDTARAVLKALPTRPLVVRDDLCLEVDYALHESVRRALHDAGAVITSEEYGTTVVIAFTVAHSDREAALIRIADASSGNVQVRECPGG